MMKPSLLAEARDILSRKVPCKQLSNVLPFSAWDQMTM